jgi:hypothetical protein
LEMWVQAAVRVINGKSASTREACHWIARLAALHAEQKRKTQWRGGGGEGNHLPKNEQLAKVPPLSMAVVHRRTGALVE